MRGTYEAWKLGREIGALLMEMTDARSQSGNSKKEDLLSRQVMTRREVVDECKTFFFGGHEMTALGLSWTLLMLAAHPEWQEALQDEIEEVAGGDGEGPLELDRGSSSPPTAETNESTRAAPVG
jgi:cytochrome P450